MSSVRHPRAVSQQEQVLPVERLLVKIAAGEPQAIEGHDDRLRTALFVAEVYNSWTTV